MKISVSAWGKCLYEASEPQYELIKEHFLSVGLHVVPLGDSGVAAYVAFEHDSFWLKRYRSISKSAKRFLVSFEPRVVKPKMFRPKVRASYDVVLVPSAMHKVLGNELEYFGGGYYTEVPETCAYDHTQRHLDFALVNENKFSVVSGAMYSDRVRIAKALAKCNYSVGLAGGNWDRGILWHILEQSWALFSALRAVAPIDLRKLRVPVEILKPKLLELPGKVDSAVDYLSRARFALVIENERSYVTEKLFLAIQAGCLPIYVGPPLQQFGIPKGLAIECEPKVREILSRIASLTSEQEATVRAQGAEWIRLPHTRNRWIQDMAFHRIARILAASVTGYPEARNIQNLISQELENHG